MSAVEIIALAASVSLLAGWRLYLCVLAVGIAMRTGWLDLPAHLQSLDVLANGWVIGIAAVGATAEFFADKIAWVDSAWDTVHTLVRPVGGAVLALALVDTGNPVWQVVTLLLGGGATLLTHGAKATMRAAVNLSPEPVSNVVVSTGEDVATAGALAAALASPIAAALVALTALIGAVLVLVLVKRVLRPRKRLSGPPAA